MNPSDSGRGLSQSTDRAAEIALTTADMEDLEAARCRALQRVALLSAATAILLPMLLVLWGPIFIALTVLWVFSLAAACARYIRLACDHAALAMELEAILTTGHPGSAVPRFVRTDDRDPQEALRAYPTHFRSLRTL